jgi:diadenosine tetraphosphate (Ap4A) HIT family hydrolase
LPVAKVLAAHSDAAHPPLTKCFQKIATALSAENFNILQNNGRPAHQLVDHVHFHVIPKPNPEEGLQIGWPQQATDMDKLKKLLEEVKAKM